MKFPGSYRARLLAFVIALEALLIAFLAYSYGFTRTVILEQSREHVRNAVALYEGRLRAELDELGRMSKVVSDDLRFKEYLFVIVRVGAEGEPLNNLYQRLFGSLPTDYEMVFGDKGQLLMGQGEAALQRAIYEQARKGADLLYWQDGPQVAVFSLSPVDYGGERIGYVALGNRLDEAWLQQHRLDDGGYMFFEQDGRVLLSTLPAHTGNRFSVSSDGRQEIGGEFYQMHHIAFPAAKGNAPNLWYAESVTDLTRNLNRFNNIILLMVMLGGGGILLVGLYVVNSFNRPMASLVNLTRRVAQGELPVIDRHEGGTELDTLANRFGEMVEALRKQQAEIDQAHDRLKRSAITDSLTGLLNRHYLQELFPRLEAQARRDGGCLSLILCDLDFFKRINDGHGHLVGDDCLIHFARVMRECTRANDYLFRLGGEEFMILSYEQEGCGGEIVAEKLRQTLEAAPARSADHAIAMTVSCGVSCLRPGPDQATDLNEMMSRADKALYAAKKNGRNAVRVQCCQSGNTSHCAGQVAGTC